MSNSICTGPVSSGPNTGKTRAYIIDKATCEEAAAALSLSDTTADNTNVNNKWTYIPGCHWTGSGLYTDPSGLHGQRVARQDQQAICALVEPCIEGAIIPDGTRCACPNGVTYHSNTNYGKDQTVLCSRESLTEIVGCSNSYVLDLPTEVRCYPVTINSNGNPVGVGCSASPHKHWTSSAGYGQSSTWTLNPSDSTVYMEGTFVYHGKEINDMPKIGVEMGKTFELIGMKYNVQNELYKNWNVAGWNPTGTKQKCYPATTLPRLRGAGPLFTVNLFPFCYDALQVDSTKVYT